jgi:hypothetical protein
MRALFTAVLALPLSGCSAWQDSAGRTPDVEAACAAQGHHPGTEAWRYCMEADGAEIATGPGSPYANVDEEDDSGADDD